MSVSLHNVSKSYDRQEVVSDLSFSIEAGEVVGFLGPNGAGKSTTMKMICGYVTPTMGEISVCGFKVSEAPKEVKRHIGYLPEHNPLYSEMYIKEYLEYVARIHGIKNRRQRVDEVIALTGLEKESHKRISMLSKGYRQRVGLGQAIIHRPDVLILDEPTSGLDMNQLVDIRELITSIGRESTVILSTHIMQEVEAMCDRVLIINNGTLVADDPIHTLRQRISGEEVLTIEVNKDIPLEGFEMMDTVSRVEHEGNRIRLIHDGSKDIREDAFDTVVSNGGKILYMDTESKKMETVFQELTKSTANA